MSEYVRRAPERLDLLDEAFAVQLHQSDRAQESFSLSAQEGAVRNRPLSAPGPTHPLKKRSHGIRAVDLDDVIQVSDVDPELHGGGCHDDAVLTLGEHTLTELSFGDRKRPVDGKRVDAGIQELLRQALHLLPRIDEDESLLPRVELRDDVSRVVEIAHPIDGKLCRSGGGGWPHDHTFA